MWARSILGIAIVASFIGATVPATAQYGDLSPVLLVETGPSDNPAYRRMIFTKFLSGDYVTVNYKNYNRAEFSQVPNTTSVDIIRSCSNGAATRLSDIQKFEREEKKRARRGEPPVIARFCIKNVQNWEGGNRKRYLDPIFNGLPWAAGVN